ncbi:MAG: hypothetical protein ABIH41_04345 [Nanoarchaeota archaeon]
MGGGGIKGVGVRVEYVLVAFFILLDLLESVDLSHPVLEYVDKIVGFTVLGFLLYKSSLTRIFFGRKAPSIDVAIVLSYFLLSLKSLLEFFSQELSGESSMLSGFFTLVSQYRGWLEMISFVAGSAALVLIACVVAFRFQFRHPSTVTIMVSPGPRRAFDDVIRRFVVVSLILFAFYLAVFGLLVEWMAIAVDSPMVLIGVVVILALYVSHRHGHSFREAFYRMADFAEGFYEDVIRHLQYRGGVVLAVSGMLVLHALTDVGNFILPYISGLRTSFYLGDDGFSTMWALFWADAGGLSWFAASKLFLIYLFNLIGITLLLILPALLWYFMYRQRIVAVRRWYLGLLFLVLPAVALAPTFSLARPLQDGGVVSSVGVFIGLGSPAAFSAMFDLILIGSALMAVGVVVFAKWRPVERLCTLVAVAASQYFFVYYVWLFFSDWWSYLLSSIIALIGSGLLGVYVACVFLVFLFISAMFYLGGLVAFEAFLIRHMRRYVRF